MSIGFILSVIAGVVANIIYRHLRKWLGRKQRKGK